MKKTIIVMALAVIVAACGNSEKSTTESQINPIEKYLDIKDALVQTDAKATQKAAKDFLAATNNDGLKKALETIANSSDVAIQRSAFEKLSETMYSVVKTNGADVVLYKQYCPMAFNNKGAYWLATEQEVNNPYFGDQMLHCGSVQETISQ